MIPGSTFDPSSSSTSIFDPDNPMYDIHGEYWEETPDLFATELIKNDQISRRDDSNRKYQVNGDCTIWNSYVAFGYHQFEDCYAFADQWKKVLSKKDPLDKYHLIWKEFTRYLIHQEEITNSNLYSWTHNLVLPYLIEHDPEIEEIIQTKLPLDVTNPTKSPWTEISNKKKRSSSSSPPRSYPIAGKLNDQLPTSTTPTDTMASQLTSLGKATRQRLLSIINTTTNNTKDKFFPASRAHTEKTSTSKK